MRHPAPVLRQTADQALHGNEVAIVDLDPVVRHALEERGHLRHLRRRLLSVAIQQALKDKLEPIEPDYIGKSADLGRIDTHEHQVRGSRPQVILPRFQAGGPKRLIGSLVIAEVRAGLTELPAIHLGLQRRREYAPFLHVGRALVLAGNPKRRPALDLANRGVPCPDVALPSPFRISAQAVVHDGLMIGDEVHKAHDIRTYAQGAEMTNHGQQPDPAVLRQLGHQCLPRRQKRRDRPRWLHWTGQFQRLAEEGAYVVPPRRRHADGCRRHRLQPRPQPRRIEIDLRQIGAQDTAHGAHSTDHVALAQVRKIPILNQWDKA